MKLLLNENIPPSLSILLSTIGLESVHVTHVGLQGRSDLEIVEFSIHHEYSIITHDLDYSRIVSLSGKNRPSVLTFRSDRISVHELFNLIRNNQIQISHYLNEGALISIDDQLRCRLLPIRRI